MEYTKGRWIVETFGVTYQIFNDRGRRLKYQVASGIFNKANAQLISATPDLYEALKEMLKLAHDYEPGPLVASITEHAVKAISKAEGK